MRLSGSVSLGPCSALGEVDVARPQVGGGRVWGMSGAASKPK